MLCLLKVKVVGNFFFVKVKVKSVVVFTETFKEGVPALLLLSPRGAGAFSVPSCGDCVVPGGKGEGGDKQLLLARDDPV